MADAIAEFFGALDSRGHEPMLEKASGTLRFDVANPKRVERWYVAVNRGDVAVSRQNRAADCVVRLDRPVLEAIVSGRSNATAAMLRGIVAIEGDLDLIVLFQRLFSRPHNLGDELPAAGDVRRAS
jgi:ubiquinone biosynthesis protein UbiJ